MSSNLKVNTILPSTGSNIGIGTNGGELNVDGGCKVQVGTALTLGHSIGLQYATQNLHSAGFEINQINASGIITASSYRGDGSQLTGITGTTINNNANNRIITGSGTANTLEGESGLTYTGSRLTQSSGDTIIDQTNNGYGGLRIVDSSAGEYSVSYILGRNSGLSAHVFKYNGRTQNQSPWNNNGTGNEMGRWSAAGISFNGDTAAANCLNDYEEGSWTATTPHSGSNSGCRYIKVGDMCLVTGSVGNLSNSSSSIVEISGLPFNQRNSGVSGQVPYLGALRGYNLGTNVGNGRPPTTVVIENSKIYVGTGQGNGGWDMLAYNELGSSSNAIQFNVCYQTA